MKMFIKFKVKQKKERKRRHTFPISRVASGGFLKEQSIVSAKIFDLRFSKFFYVFEIIDLEKHVYTECLSVCLLLCPYVCM